ncbi:MAG: hypothetical protein V8S97_02590 [Oscillospiraceae bacterium]
MSHRRRNAYSSYYGSRGGSRGLADWFGLLALLCMLVCSVILLVRVLGAGVLTTVLTVVLILVLVLLNGLHAFVQLPVRRNVAGKAHLRRGGAGAVRRHDLHLHRRRLPYEVPVQYHLRRLCQDHHLRGGPGR